MWVVTLQREWCYGPFSTKDEATDFVVDNTIGERRLRDWDIHQVLSPSNISMG